jgi:hypothetical protein
MGDQKRLYGYVCNLQKISVAREASEIRDVRLTLHAAGRRIAADEFVLDPTTQVAKRRPEVAIGVDTVQRVESRYLDMHRIDV